MGTCCVGFHAIEQPTTAPIAAHQSRQGRISCCLLHASSGSNAHLHACKNSWVAALVRMVLLGELAVGLQQGQPLGLRRHEVHMMHAGEGQGAGHGGSGGSGPLAFLISAALAVGSTPSVV